MLSKNMEDRIRMIFGFSLCAASLQVVLVAYFRRGLGELEWIGTAGGWWDMLLPTLKESISFSQFLE